MNFVVKFTESDEIFKSNFGEINAVSDGGFERGYEEGLIKGEEQGYTKGYVEGEQQGFTEGAKEEYDKFWDKFQDYGKRYVYTSSFGRGWTDEIFKPKYDIKLKGSIESYYIFQYSDIVNLKKCLEDADVKLDTSGISYALNLFANSKIEIAPQLDFTGASTIGAFNNASKLKWVDKVILSSIRAQSFTTSVFSGCNVLEHCIFEGVIKAAGFNMQYCVLLDKESITSVINCLSNDTSNLTVTLSLQAINKAFETSEGTNDGSNSNEWTTLIGTKQNWTIALA